MSGAGEYLCGGAGGRGGAKTPSMPKMKDPFNGKGWKENVQLPSLLLLTSNAERSASPLLVTIPDPAYDQYAVARCAFRI